MYTSTDKMKGKLRQKRWVKVTYTKMFGKKNYSAGYNMYKNFDGKQYTGMKVGRSHEWYYDKGGLKEMKVTLISIY